MLIELENLDNLPKIIWTNEGVKYTLEGHEVRSFSDDVIKLFLAQHPRYVREYTAKILPTFPNEAPTEWIANTTGDFRVPATVNRLEIIEGKEKYREVPNPKLTPKTLFFSWLPPQKIIELDGGATSECLSFPASSFSIPPYTRMPTSPSIASWLMEMVNTNPQECDKGNLKLCRTPTNFEPNTTWGYDDMRFYANMVDEKVFNKDTILGDNGKYPPGRNVNDEKRDELRIQLWRELYFYLIDDRYALPTEQAFTARKTLLMQAKRDVSKEISSLKKAISKEVTAQV